MIQHQHVELKTVTKSRRHVEYIGDYMDDDLEICSEDLDDDMDTGVIPHLD